VGAVVGAGVGAVVGAVVGAFVGAGVFPSTQTPVVESEIHCKYSDGK